MNKNYDITNEMKIFIVLLFLLVPNPVLAYNKVIELNDLTKVSHLFLGGGEGGNFSWLLGN